MTEEKTLYSRVRDSEVFGLLYGIEHQLAVSLPDGAKNHKRDIFRHRVSFRREMIEEGHFLPITATIRGYREQDSKSYRFIMNLLEESEGFGASSETVMHPARFEEEAVAVA